MNSSKDCIPVGLKFRDNNESTRLEAVKGWIAISEGILDCLDKLEPAFSTGRREKGLDSDQNGALSFVVTIRSYTH